MYNHETIKWKFYDNSIVHNLNIYEHYGVISFYIVGLCSLNFNTACCLLSLISSISPCSSKKELIVTDLLYIFSHTFF